MSAALRLSERIHIPTPPITLGEAGMKEWTATITAYSDWETHELQTLCNACLATDQVEAITEQLAAEEDFKKQRQLRSDRNAAADQHRKQMRELALAQRPNDSRPPRIAGRYN